MYQPLEQDRARQKDLLHQVLAEAEEYLTQRNDAFVSPIYPSGVSLRTLPKEGMGAKSALDLFKAEYSQYVPASSGPRYFGFVIGGITPAALAGDWLTSLYDQNAFGLPNSVDRQIEQEAIGFLRELLDLPEDFTGLLASGATMANTTALAIAREWAAQKEGKTANDGVYGLTPPTILTGTAHASIYKGLSILGLGRNQVTLLPCLPGRESVNVTALEAYLAEHPQEKCIVIANLGTVNSGDVDDLPAIAALKDKYDFYLHVEGAIGAVAAASPLYRPYFNGAERADSFTIDAHKWLNTPYDGAAVLVRGKELQEYQFRVFAQMEQVNSPCPDQCAYTNLGPEGSRRWRALPIWLSLAAYGKAGYQDIVERNCAMARLLAERLSASPWIQVPHQVRLNVVAFTLNLPEELCTDSTLNAFALLLRQKGVTFMNTARVLGKPVVRSTISNWMTSEREIEDAAASIIACAEEFCAQYK